MNYENLKTLTSQKESIRGIAKILNVSPSTVRYWLTKYDLKTTPITKAKKDCKNCNTELINLQSLYCNPTCHRDFEYKQYIKDWKLGIIPGHVGKTLQLSNSIRKYMLLKYNNTCIECSWNKLHPVDNKPLVEIDHIDGDASNCREDNLRVLCPNCHSMTSTFRARNKNSRRDRT